MERRPAAAPATYYMGWRTGRPMPLAPPSSLPPLPRPRGRRSYLGPRISCSGWRRRPWDPRCYRPLGIFEPICGTVVTELVFLSPDALPMINLLLLLLLSPSPSSSLALLTAAVSSVRRLSSPPPLCFARNTTADAADAASALACRLLSSSAPLVAI